MREHLGTLHSSNLLTESDRGLVFNAIYDSADGSTHFFNELLNYRVYRSDKSPTRAGCAIYHTKEIELHTALFYPERAENLREVILHEIAHHIAYEVYGHRGHGHEWANVMRRLQLEPAKYHTLGLLRAGAIYQCQDCKRTIQKARKIRKGYAYLCCNKPMKLL